MAVPTKSSHRVWVMLKPSAEPHYKQLPAEQFSISRELVSKLVAEGRVSGTVASVLSAHQE
jgi:hypothetical protein